jgi:integrase
MTGRTLPALISVAGDGEQSAGNLPALNEALASARDYRAAARSAGTRATYGRAWRMFEEICTVLELSPLPADTTTVGAALAYGASRRNLAHSTLTLLRAAVRARHLEARLPDPTAGTDLKQMLRGIRREAVAAGRTVRKVRGLLAGAGPADAPTTSGRGTSPQLAAPEAGAMQTAAPVLERVLAAISGNTLSDIRDRSLILLGYAGALRRSELCDLTWEGVERVPGRGLLLTLSRSKGDRQGTGVRLAIPRTGGPLCPVAALEAWQRQSMLNSGPLYRAILRGERLLDTPLEPGSIARLLKRRAEAAGYDAAEISGHSLRRGVLTSAARRGANVWKLAELSRHRDVKTLKEYIEAETLFDSHAAADLLKG